MASISQEPAAPRRLTWGLVLSLTRMWASLAIVVVWLAVLFTAIYGPDITSTTPGGTTTSTPSAVAVALFAFLATWVIAKHGYRGDRDPEKR
jgi:hypothetical protein